MKKKKITAIIGLTAISLSFIWWASFNKSSSIPSEPLQETDNLPLQVPITQTIDLRQRFLAAYREAVGRKLELRPLYEEWIDQIGANGIIEVVERVSPVCHEDGHDLGKVIYKKTQNIGTGLQVCDGMCYSGCMHGVLMEAFGLEGDEHVEAVDIQDQAREICEESAEITAYYSPGDCYHGLGHAFMYIADYDIEKAMDQCDQLSGYAARYYCATGGYMEYMSRYAKNEYAKGGLLTPCAEAPYPAACFRYRFPQTFGYYLQDGGTLRSAQAECGSLPDSARLGCYHGLGNGLMSALVLNKITLTAACASPDADEQLVCVDGAIERAARYYPERAREICTQERGAIRRLCSTAVERGMYNMERDFAPYSR